MTDIKYKFAINVCPMCDAELKVVGNNNPNYYNCGDTLIWECPNYVAMPHEYVHMVAHYQVEWDKKTGVIVQHMVAPPYFLDTFNTDWKTRIHLNTPGPYSHPQFVMAVDQIHPDTPERLLERVRTLVIFS